MVATRGRTFKRPWRRSCLSSKLKSSSAPIGRKDSWCFHAVGSSNAPLLGSTAAEGLPRIGRTSIATRWRSCGLPQSASCSENFVILPDVFGQTLREQPFSIRIVNPPSAPEAKPHSPGTADFRYWTAAEALRRGADFWGALLPGTSWEVGAILPVDLDFGIDLNAFYDREGLKFFHGSAAGRTVFSGESPDVVCHELGHAVLDSFKPQLFDAASIEVAAF